jgi:DNA-binding FadR family transcriptional regulator
VLLYYQLAQAIEAAIRDGDLAPGDRFENELALAKRLTLSRPTTRRAIGAGRQGSAGAQTRRRNQVVRSTDRLSKDNKERTGTPH